MGNITRPQIQTAQNLVNAIVPVDTTTSQLFDQMFQQASRKRQANIARQAQQAGITDQGTSDELVQADPSGILADDTWEQNYNTAALNTYRENIRRQAHQAGITDQGASDELVQADPSGHLADHIADDIWEQNYNTAARKIYVAQRNMEFDERMLQAADEFSDDPPGYLKQVEEIRSEIGREVPGAENVQFNMAAQERALRSYYKIRDNHRRKTIEEGRLTLKTRMAELGNQIYSDIMNGGTGESQLQEIAGMLDAYTDSNVISWADAAAVRQTVQFNIKGAELERLSFHQPDQLAYADAVELGSYDGVMLSQEQNRAIAARIRNRYNRTKQEIEAAELSLLEAGQGRQILEILRDGKASHLPDNVVLQTSGGRTQRYSSDQLVQQGITDYHQQRLQSYADPSTGEITADDQFRAIKDTADIMSRNGIAYDAWAKIMEASAQQISYGATIEDAEPRALREGLMLYQNLYQINPELARAHAGKNAELFDSIFYKAAKLFDHQEDPIGAALEDTFLQKQRDLDENDLPPVTGQMVEQAMYHASKQHRREVGWFRYMRSYFSDKAAFDPDTEGFVERRADGYFEDTPVINPGIVRRDVKRAMKEYLKRGVEPEAAARMAGEAIRDNFRFIDGYAIPISPRNPLPDDYEQLTVDAVVRASAIYDMSQLATAWFGDNSQNQAVENMRLIPINGVDQPYYIIIDIRTGRRISELYKRREDADLEGIPGDVFTLQQLQDLADTKMRERGDVDNKLRKLREQRERRKRQPDLQLYPLEYGALPNFFRPNPN